MMARLRSLVVPALFTLLVGALLVGLGVWQLHRLGWKEGLIARIDARSRAVPQPLPPASAWSGLRPADYDYRHVALEGRFRHDEAALVFHGAEEGAGYLVLAPLDLTSGGTVIVNRGFVPDGLQAHAASPGSQPEGLVRVTGLMRPPEARNLFTPADEPARNIFFTRDPKSIATRLGLADSAPFTIDEDATPGSAGWPRGGTTELTLPNNHLSYALTWFGLALALVGVFTTFAWRRLAREPEFDRASAQDSASAQDAAAARR